MEIHGVPPFPPIPPSNSTLAQQLGTMIDTYRSLMRQYQDNPTLHNTDKVVSFVYKMKAFLQDHKKELFGAEKAQGWSKFSKKMNDGYEGIYNACMIGINTFLNPETRNSGNLYFVNEQVTQLHWMLENHRP